MRMTVVGCWGGSPRVGGACSGYLLESGGERLLVDCGPSVAAFVQRLCPLTEIDHVLVSHYHYDHASDAGALIYARLVHRILGLTQKDLRFYALAEEPAFAQLAHEQASCAVGVDQGAAVEIGPFTCEFLRTKHPVPCLAMRVRDVCGATFAYTADAAYTDELARFVSDADVLVSECSLYRGVDGQTMGHMSCDDVARLANIARPRTLVLSHLPVYGDTAELLSCVEEGLADGACDEVILAGRAGEGDPLVTVDVACVKEGC